MTTVTLTIPEGGLVIAPATHGLVKGSDDSEVAYRVVKATRERQFTLGLAYPAMVADKGRAADGFIDAVSAEVLEETAWAWLGKYRDVNLFHSDNPSESGHFTPTESYIYRGPDWVQNSPVDGDSYTIKAGDWLLGGVWDDYGWAAVKARLVNGWSPEGTARRGVPTPEFLAQLRR